MQRANFLSDTPTLFLGKVTIKFALQSKGGGGGGVPLFKGNTTLFSDVLVIN